MIEIIRKKYKIELEFLGNEREPIKTFFFYQQGSLREILITKDKIERAGSLDEWLFEFLENCAEKDSKFSRELFEQLTQEKILELSSFIFSTYCKGYFVKDGEAKKMKNQRGVQTPSNALIAFLMEKTNETLESLLEMTWEQINYIIAGIIWNMNELTPAGKQRNFSNSIMEESRKELSDEDALKMARDLEARIIAKEKLNKTQ